jgi:DNA polymerase-3 subunit beta
MTETALSVPTIKIERAKILPLIENVKGLFGRTLPFEALNNILIHPLDNAVLIRASNYETSVEATFGAECVASEPFLINGKRFCDIVRCLQGDAFTISMSAHSGRIKLVSGAQSIEQPLAGATSFPALAEPATAKCGFSITAEDLRLMLSLAKIGSDDAHKEPKCRSVAVVAFADKVEVVSTNGVKIAIASKRLATGISFEKADGSSMAFVDRKYVKHIEDLLRDTSGDDMAVRVSWSESDLFVETPGAWLSCRLQSFNYPSYAKALASLQEGVETKTSFPKADFINSLRFVTLNADDWNRQVRISRAGDSKTRLLFVHPDLGDTETEISCDGPLPEGFQVAFRNTFLDEVASAIPGDTLTAHYGVKTKGWIITDESLPERGIDFKFLVPSQTLA